MDCIITGWILFVESWTREDRDYSIDGYEIIGSGILLHDNKIVNGYVRI